MPEYTPFPQQNACPAHAVAADAAAGGGVGVGVGIIGISTVAAAAGRLMAWLLLWLVLLLVLLLPAVLSAPAQAAIAPGQVFSNTARADYVYRGQPQQVQAVATATAARRTPARIAFLQAVDTAQPGAPAAEATQVQAGSCRNSASQSGSWQPQTAAGTVFAGALRMPRAVSLAAAPVYLGRDAAFVRVIDPDQNTNPQLPDTVEVTVTAAAASGGSGGGSSDSETLRLTETGASTGVFVGWVQLSNDGSAAVAGDCVLSVTPDATVQARYVDRYDASDARSTSALVDPLGTVFRSDTGAPVDGAEVTLVDAASGQPAQVFGDDGRSAYPATVTSGAAVTDASGRVYPPVAGRYRFPFVRPGKYRLKVVPPSGLRFPSGMEDSALQQLPSAPYALSEASRGGVLEVVMMVVRTDVPLDPRTGKLLISKKADKTQVAPGDFVRYTLSVTNADTAAVSGVTVRDTLPQGLRYRKGTAQADGMTGGSAVPVHQSANGSGLRFDLGTLEQKQRVTVSYTAEVTVHTPMGDAVNVASVSGDGATGAFGSSARAAVEVVDDLMASRAILLGTVFVGECPKAGEKYPKKTLSGARVVLHNGRFAVSGSDGAWHVEGLQPGTVMVRLDALSVPQGYRISPCPNGSRNSAQGWAQTLRTQPGGMNRVNFFVLPPAGATMESASKGKTEDATQGETEGATEKRADKAETKSESESKAEDKTTGKTGTADEAADEAAAETTDRAADEAASAGSLTTGSRSHRRLAAIDRARRQALAGDAADAADGADSGAGGGTAAWVWPPPQKDAVPNTYASILLRHAPDARVRLQLNGESVSGFHYEGVKHNESGSAAVSYWRNVHLQRGDNRLVAEMTDSSQPEQPAQRLERTLHVGTAPVRAELLPQRSRLIANGRDPVVVAVRLLDKDDQPVLEDVSGEVSLSAPYRMFDDLEQHLINPISGKLDDAHRATPGYTVGADGVAELKIAPTTQTGELELGFRFNDSREQTITARLLPQNRDWIVVGFAEASLVGRRLKKEMQPLSGYAVDADTIPGERVALFAKGVIPGEVLMTLAYDSARPAISRRHQDAQSETTATAPFYTVYADNAQSGTETPTDGRLYLKLEKSTFQLLWGNFNTALSRTELARYDRSVYGLRSSWQGSRWRYTAFAFENRTASQRDVIATDGTTGSFRLGRVPVLEQSERVSVVTRQRLDSGTELNRRELTRGVDYTLDYASGTLIIAQPLAAADSSGNPISLEVDYESRDAAGGRTIAGGRVAVQATPDTEVGLTLIHDGDSRLGGQLAAVDVRSDITPHTTLEAEVGTSRRTDTQGVRSGSSPAAGETGGQTATPGGTRGSAFRAEIQHQRGDTTARAYVRQTDTGYGLPDQSTLQTGVRSVGAEASLQLTESTSLEAAVRQQQAMQALDRSRAAEATVQYRTGGWLLGSGLRWAQERDAGGSQDAFGQWLLSAAYTTPGNRLTLRGNVEMAASRHDAIRYPDRVAVGADYRITGNLTALASHEWRRDRQQRTLSQAGLKYTPWTGGSIQTVLAQTSLSDTETAAGRLRQTALRTQASQTFELGGGWSVNGQITHARRLRGNRFSPRSNNSPLNSTDNTTATATATATDADADAATDIDTAARFTSAGLGLSYSGELWSGYARYETVWAARQRRHSVSAGVLRRLQNGHNLLLSTRLEQLPNRVRSSNIRLQHAWRPPASPWSLLQRLDWVDNRAGLAAQGSSNHRVVYNKHLNYRSTAGWEVNTHLGIKRVLDSVGEQDLRATTGVLGVEGRADINRWLDVGAQRVVAHSWQSGVTNWGHGMSLGIKPVENAQLDIGYNWRGIKDRDFFAANQRARGVYLNVRLLFDENLLGLGRGSSGSSTEKDTTP